MPSWANTNREGWPGGKTKGGWRQAAHEEGAREPEYARPAAGELPPRPFKNKKGTLPRSDGAAPHILEEIRRAPRRWQG